MSQSEPQDEWQEWWDARIDAMRPVLGEPDDGVYHASVPFYLGGTADVIVFPQHIDGYVYVTSDLIGDDQQIVNDIGHYELMCCERNESDWIPGLLSNLARYTADARLNPWDTMDIGAALPDGSTIESFLFVKYATFEVKGLPAGLLLCLGITASELAACKSGQAESLLSELKSASVFPFTDLFRESVNL